MALKKIRFVWGTPPLPDGRWRVGLFHLQEAIDPSRPPPPGGLPKYWKKYLHHTLNLSVRGSLVWGTVFSLAAYLTGAALVLYRLESRNSHNLVTYPDLVLPTRWGNLTNLRAQGYAAQGRSLLSEGNFSQGLGLLRLALDRNPTDKETRQDVARLFVAIRLRQQAEALLLQGLDYGYPGRAYLALAFALSEEGGRPTERIALVEAARKTYAAMPPESRPQDDARWLDQESVKAYLANKRGDDARALVEKNYPPEDPFRIEITLLALLEANQPQAAMELAATWAERTPRAPEPWRLLARAARSAGDDATMDAALKRLIALDPVKPDALIYAITQSLLAKREASARKHLEEILFRHGSRPELYPALAAVMSVGNSPFGFERIEQELLERGLSPAPVLWAKLRLNVQAREWSAALSNIDSLRALPTHPPLSAERTTYLETMARLSRACLDVGSGNQSSLVAIIAERPGTLKLYTLVLEALLDASRFDTAGKILTLAEGSYPVADVIVSIRSKVESGLAQTPLTEAPRLAAHSGFARFDDFREAFDARVAAADASGALQMLTAVRRAQPEWFGSESAQLERMELPLRARGDDPLRLQLLVRMRLERETGVVAELLSLARQIHGQGHTANALLIVKELQRRSPNSDELLEQIAQWEKPLRQRPMDAY